MFASVSVSCVGPLAMIVPPASSTTSEQYAATSARSWCTSTMVHPAALSSWRTSTMVAWLAASTPAKGSSRMMTSGSPASVRASRVRWRCPPDRAEMGRLARSASPTRSRARRAAALSRLPGQRHQGRWAMRPKRATSKSVAGKSQSMSACWGMYPKRPSTSISPVLGMRPTMALTRVDFPEPLAPMSPVKLPGRMSRETPSSTVRLP